MIKQSVIGTGPNYADLYVINIEFKDFGGKVLHKINSGQIVVSQDWKQLIYEYEVSEHKRVASITITEQAKDVEYWAGNFGTRLMNPVIIITCEESENKNNVSIMDAIKIKNNKSFNGCDTFLYFDKDLQKNEFFWSCNYSVGYGKKYMNPCLSEIGATNIHQISHHSWFDLSLSDYNKSLNIENNNEYSDLISK